MEQLAASFFEGCRHAFAEAHRRAPGPRRRLALDGLGLRLAFAGPRLAERILPALALPEDRGESEASFDLAVWDQEETGVSAPPAPWLESMRSQPHSGQWRIPGLKNLHLKICLDAQGRILWLLDLKQRQGLVWIRRASDLPAWEHIHPLRGPLHGWLQSEGRLMLHAGSLGLPTGGLLLVGRGGSGKSTSVLAGLAGGLASAGDDYVAIGRGERPAIHALYGMMRLYADHADRFPGLLPASDRSDPEKEGTKLAADLQRHRPDAFVPSLPLHALVAPQVRPAERCRLEPLSAQTALLALAPSTLQQLHPNAEALPAMQRLCDSLPCHRLVLGRDLTSVPALLRGLLS